MEIILALLLHLRLIQPGGVYTEQQLHDMEQQNRQQIEIFISHPNALQQIIQKESRDISTITVIDDSLIE